MNYTRIAQLLRQLADEIDCQNPSLRTATHSHDQEEILKDILPEEEWERFNLRMPFGKYAGELLLDISASYFEWLGRNDFTGRGDKVGDAITKAIEIVNGVEPEDEPIPHPKKRSTPTPLDDLDDNIPF